MQKRMYSSGYNFTWNTNKHNNPTYNNVTEYKIDSVNNSVEESTVLANTNDYVELPKKEKTKIVYILPQKRHKKNTLLDSTLFISKKTVSAKQIKYIVKTGKISKQIAIASLIGVITGGIMYVFFLNYTNNEIFILVFSLIYTTSLVTAFLAKSWAKKTLKLIKENPHKVNNEYDLEETVRTAKQYANIALLLFWLSLIIGSLISLFSMSVGSFVI
ncbi:MAG: hypothetical protein ABL940_00125 [Bacteroidia bacterium]